MKTYAIILAGGKGLRLGADLPKQFLSLGGKPIIQWSIEAFLCCEKIDGIVIVSPENEMPRMSKMADRIDCAKIRKTVHGGDTRQGSSWNALQAISYNRDDILLFHDAARPFVTQKIITDCIYAAKQTGAAGTYIAATDTISEIRDGQVRVIPPRENLYYTQTPQAFKYDVIKKGHESAQTCLDLSVTDDVSLVLAAGHPVTKVEGDPVNIKITTPFDYDLAQWLAAEKFNG